MAQEMRTRKVRQASPERWQRALQRALFAGVEAKQLASTGEWIVSSASRPGIAYRTNSISCDCEAAMLGGDPVCLHRAAYWYAQRVLELDPEPESPASAAPLVCFRCRGSEVACPVCQGAAWRPSAHRRRRCERRPEPARANSRERPWASARGR